MEARVAVPQAAQEVNLAVRQRVALVAAHVDRAVDLLLEVTVVAVRAAVAAAATSVVVVVVI
jgi:hypothetical protein